MSRFQKVQLRLQSRFLLRATLRLRRSWTLWRLQSTLRQQTREQQRLTLLLRLLDSQHLRLKELHLLEQQLLHRLQEQQDSQSYREQRQPQVLLSMEPLSERERLNRLLGL